MKTAFLSGLIVALGLAFAPRIAVADQRRFAVFVGSNIGDHHESILHHAQDDATRVAQTLRTLGDFPPDQVLVLNGVTAPELRDAIIRLNARLREQHDAVLVLFYSGHADAESLHLAGTHFPLAELKALLVGSPATSRVLVVDACRSGSLIGLKGAQPTQPFSIAALDEPAPEGFAVLASSTATENAQESVSLGGSFFTYYLNSGLLGAADQNRDGAVTLSELYAFASSETRAATVSSPAGPQTPTFQFMLGGKHDLVLTRPGRRDARMGVLEFAEGGRYIVQPWDAGVLSAPIAELAAHEPGAKLALPPGRYHITRRGERDIAERDADVTAGETTGVTAASMARVDLGRVVRKGDVRRSATGFAVAAGWRTDDLGAGTLLSMGSGPMLLATLRHDRRRFSLEARVGWEREVVSNPSIQIENQGLSLTAAGLFPIDLRLVTLSLGIEAGLILVHQSYSTTANEQSVDALPLIPGRMTPQWFDGFQFGPLAQIDFPLGERAYLRFEAGLPSRFFSSSGRSETFGYELLHSAHLHLVAGAGISF
ncbi:MAG TPA: caspase family protein [Polyangia bacterium]|jgi:Caspase domain.|nr:caspase family protein [Polyangia bacterium]